jgi:hypothetical protein
MMGTRQRNFRPLPESISLEELVPKDNFYRRLEAAVDLFREGAGAPLYAEGGTWRRTTSGYLPQWRGCTLLLSPASFSTEPSLRSGRVHNTL